MRKRNHIKLLFALLLGLVLVAVSCKGPDEPKELDPTITLDGNYVSSDVTVNTGDSVRIVATAAKGKDGAKLQTFTMTFTYPTAQSVKVVRDVKNLEVATWDTTFSVGTVEGVLQVDITIVDKDGRSATRTIKITIQKPVVNNPTAPKSKTGVVLTYDVQNSQYGQSFFSTSNLTAYSEAQAQGVANMIDIAYFYSSVSTHNLVSPQDLTNSNIYGGFAINWGQVPTEFRKHPDPAVTADSIRNIKDEQVLTQLFNAASPVTANCGTTQCNGTRVNNSVNPYIGANSVILFKGANGKYGALIITNMNGNGSITFDVYVQN